MPKLLKLVPLVLIILVGVPILGMAGNEALKLLGLRTIPVPVVGTGSMYPSLFWSKSEGGPEDENVTLVEEYRTTPHLYRYFGGINIAGHYYLRREIGRGDMVAFKNQTTASILQNDGKDQSAGFIKRVIGTPGDTIELRDGFVYLGGTLLTEPYINTPRSTYGGEAIKDCKQVRVPPSHYLVLGDNRKVSLDSRFQLGLIKGADIEYVLPLAEQKIYYSLWRDPSRDSELLGSPSLDGNEFVKLVNAARIDHHVSKLTLQSPLIKSASLRGEKLLVEENTNYSMQQAMDLVGYHNIVVGEFVSRGHFTAQELLQNLLYNPSTAKQILLKDYSDLGVTAVNREIDGCPTQIIVGHLGGYIPATYDQQTIESWRTLHDNLRATLPSWEQAQGYEGINQEKLSALLSILRRRLSLAQTVIDTMDKRAWLSDDLMAKIKADETDAKQAESLSFELNER